MTLPNLSDDGTEQGDLHWSFQKLGPAFKPLPTVITVEQRGDNHCRFEPTYRHEAP